MYLLYIPSSMCKLLSRHLGSLRAALAAFVVVVVEMPLSLAAPSTRARYTSLRSLPLFASPSRSHRRLFLLFAAREIFFSRLLNYIYISISASAHVCALVSDCVSLFLSPCLAARFELSHKYKRTALDVGESH